MVQPLLRCRTGGSGPRHRMQDAQTGGNSAPAGFSIKTHGFEVKESQRRFHQLIEALRWVTLQRFPAVVFPKLNKPTWGAAALLKSQYLECLMGSSIPDGDPHPEGSWSLDPRCFSRLFGRCLLPTTRSAPGLSPTPHQPLSPLQPLQLPPMGAATGGTGSRHRRLPLPAWLPAPALPSRTASPLPPSLYFFLWRE